MRAGDFDLAFTFFRPGFWMDMVAPPFNDVAPAEIEQAFADADPGAEIRLTVNGLNAVGDPVTFTAPLQVPEGETGADRLLATGVETIVTDGKVMIDNVAFGSAGQEAGLDWDQEITAILSPAAQPSKYWMYIPALLLLAGVVMMQRRRVQPAPAAA